MTPPATTLTNDMAELPATCSIVETQRTHLNQEEQELLKELLRPGASVEAVIPDDATSDQLWRTLDACVRGLNMLESRARRLHPIIGRILLIFQDKPSLYKDLGYETFSEFMEKGVYGTLGVHRSAAYVGKLVARDWPQLNPDRFAKIGPKKLEIISKFSKGNDPNAEMHLQNAEKMRVPELKNYYENRGFLRPGEATGATFSLTTNRAIYDHVKEFFTSPRVHSYVGTKDWGEILEALVQEGESSWLETTERARRQ
jgi:hypothetical protein